VLIGWTGEGGLGDMERPFSPNGLSIFFIARLRSRFLDIGGSNGVHPYNPLAQIFHCSRKKEREPLW
jgi:hypothetical protein